ncbi:hypothetical protein P7C70_g3071, partial [Phenoliferia sp. Uapishka_3]
MQAILQRRQLLRDPVILALKLRRDSRLHTATSNASPPSINDTVVDSDSPQDLELGTPNPSTKNKEGKEGRVDPFLVVFPPGAVDNPQNWSLLRRAFVVFLVAQIALCVGAAASINSAGAVQAGAALRVSQEVPSLRILGSESSSGESPPWTPVIAFPTLLTFSSNSFFAGFFGSTPLANAGGTLADVTTPRERTIFFVLFSFCGFLGPVMGPVIGGYIAQSPYLGYRATDWAQAIWGFTLVIVLICFMPETHTGVLLKRRADDSYLATAASALSILTVVRYPLSGAAVMFTAPMFDKLGNHWALTLLAFLSILVSFVPWIFFYQGPKIRSWSRYTPKF